MSHYNTVLYSVEQGIGTITINRPDKMNSFSRELRKELFDVVEQANADANVRVVILAAAGRAFSAGADLTEEELEGWTSTGELITEYKPIILALQHSPKIVITAVQGAAAGAGSAFALIGDLCVMADNAYLYEAFAAIGLVPDCGATWFLTQQLGQKKALELILSGEKLSAQRCVELGLANRVVAADDLAAETRKLALELLEKAPLALSYSKKLVKAMPTISLSEAINLEAEYQHVCITSEDFIEGSTAFLEKRKPKFVGK